MTARIRLSLAGCLLALSLPVMASPAGVRDGIEAMGGDVIEELKTRQ